VPKVLRPQDLTEIQKPGEQTEQKPDAGLKKPDNLSKERAANGDQDGTEISSKDARGPS